MDICLKIRIIETIYMQIIPVKDQSSTRMYKHKVFKYTVTV